MNSILKTTLKKNTLLAVEIMTLNTLTNGWRASSIEMSSCIVRLVPSWTKSSHLMISWCDLRLFHCILSIAVFWNKWSAFSQGTYLCLLPWSYPYWTFHTHRTDDWYYSIRLMLTYLKNSANLFFEYQLQANTKTGDQKCVLSLNLFLPLKWRYDWKNIP